MTTILPRGANRPATGSRITVTLEMPSAPPDGAYAVAILPVAGAPACLPLNGDAPDWVDASGGDPLDYAILLDRLPDTAERLLVVPYAGRAAATFKPIAPTAVIVDGARIVLEGDDLFVSALVAGELYKRDGAWKLRARVEGVFEGIEELGRRLGIAVVDRANVPNAPTRGGAGGRHAPGSTWTGSGFYVAPALLVTNAHVVDGAREMRVASFEGTFDAEPVIVDHRNDLALVRARGAPAAPLMSFRAGHGPVLGESVHSLGYPLSGILGSGPQVASGVVSGLLGPDDDLRLVQNTAPIQPGSSGGPLLDEGGLVIGVASASLVRGQNVNFAIRAALAATLVEVAGLTPTQEPQRPARSLVEIVREGRGGVVRVECKG